MKFHQFANSDGEVLIVKRIPQDRKTRGGFSWPSGVGSVVTCPDWNDRCECGGGLHGWPWGFGIGDGSDFDVIGDIWLVLGAKPEEIVGEIERGAKCKAKQVTIRLEGNFQAAMQFVRAGFDACVAVMAKEYGDYSTAASSGDYSKAASSGDYSKAASSGDGSTAASSGDYSTAASSGNYSTAASSGDYSKAASSGDRCTAEASGVNCVAALAGTGRIRVGERGAFAVAYWTDADGWRFLAGKVGENEIKADTWYVVKDGQLVEEK